MDVLKKTAFVLGLALLGAGLSACNKNQEAANGAAQPNAGQSSTQQQAPATAGPGYGSSSSSGGSSSSSSGAMETAPAGASSSGG